MFGVLDIAHDFESKTSIQQKIKQKTVDLRAKLISNRNFHLLNVFISKD